MEKDRIHISIALLFLLTLSSLFTGNIHAETWMGLEVAPEDRCSEYNRDREYRYSQSLEPQILEQMGGEIRCRYTGQVYDTLSETDIEHVVAISQAHDSGLCAADEETRRTFVSDFDNLLSGSPGELNRLWFVETVIKVKKKYGLTVDRAEMEALAGVLAELETVIRMRSFGTLKALSPGAARGE